MTSLFMTKSKGLEKLWIYGSTFLLMVKVNNVWPGLWSTRPNHADRPLFQTSLKFTFTKFHNVNPTYLQPFVSLTNTHCNGITHIRCYNNNRMSLFWAQPWSPEYCSHLLSMAPFCKGIVFIKHLSTTVACTQTESWKCKIQSMNNKQLKTFSLLVN